MGQFKNREELLEGLESGEIVLESRPSDRLYPAQHFLHIYERRAEHLRKFQTEHSERLRNDVLELIQNLTDTPSEQVVAWGVREATELHFAVFETSDGSKILGCTKGLDKRLTSVADWEAAWGRDH